MKYKIYIYNDKLTKLILFSHAKKKRNRNNSQDKAKKKYY